MTVEAENDLALRTGAIVVGVRGHVVVAGDANRDGQLAIWHVSAEGLLCGAWCHPYPTSPSEAASLLRLIEGRLLVDDDTGTAERLVSSLSTLAAAEDSPLFPLVTRTVGWMLAELHQEADAIRAVYEQEASSRGLAPLTLPPLPPADTPETDAAFGVRVDAAASLAARAALGRAQAVARCVAWWGALENARARRTYLRRPPQPLSGAWLQALRDAATPSASAS